MLAIGWPIGIGSGGVIPGVDVQVAASIVVSVGP
jgi:hypothetical protein